MSRLNVVIGADIKQLETNFNKAVKLVQESGDGMSASVAKAAKDIQDRLQALASAKPTARVVRQLQTMAMEARAMGPAFSEMADEFIREAGRMQDEIGDTRAEIGYFASDTRKLDAVIGGANAVAGAFGVVEGAMAAVGVENEDVQKTMMKLQGVMAMLNGLTAIQNALQSESAVAIGATTAIRRIEAYVMGQATVAARAYSAALVATGFVAAIAVISGIAMAFAEVGRKTQKAKKDTEDFYKVQEEKAKKTAEAISKFDDEVIGKAVTNAKRKGLTDQQLRDAELKAVEAAIKGRKAQLAEEEKYSARYTEISNYIMTLEKRKEDLITENIVAANKKREDLAKQAAEKQKGIIEKAAQDYIEIYNRFGAKAANNFTDNFGKKFKAEPVKLEDLKGAGLKIVSAMDGVAKQINKQPIQLKIDVQTEYSSFIKDLMQMRDAIDAAFEQLIESTLTAIGEAIGGMIAGEQGAFRNFGNVALKAVADFMKAFGAALITTAIASDAFQKLILANPIAAAAAGVALVAGSAVITAQLKKGPEFTAFADGGIVYGPTLGLMGEYPGARSNPEVIAPLDKLKDMIGGAGNDSGYIASTHISGRDLAIVLNRYNNDYSRG
jgi:hypothetical protein